MTKLDIKTLGLTIGCLWSLSVLLLGVVAMTWHWGSRIVHLFSTVYIGYKATFAGSLIGAFWAFLDGAMTGVVIAWVYNRFVS